MVVSSSHLAALTTRLQQHADRLNQLLCDQTLPPAAPTPKRQQTYVFKHTCPVSGHTHVVPHDYRAIQAYTHTIANRDAHALVKTLAADLHKAARQELHDMVHVLSRRYLPLLKVLQPEVNAVDRLYALPQKRVNQATKNALNPCLLAPDQVDDEDLLEFMSCYAKNAYPTAEAARQGSRQHNGRRHMEYLAYQCGYCQAYHLGHRTGSTTPLAYRLTRARMMWHLRRDKANEYVRERRLLINMVD